MDKYNSIAIIIGGTSSMARSLALQLEEKGFLPVLIYRNELLLHQIRNDEFNHIFVPGLSNTDIPIVVEKSLQLSAQLKCPIRRVFYLAMSLTYKEELFDLFDSDMTEADQINCHAPYRLALEFCKYCKDIIFYYMSSPAAFTFTGTRGLEQYSLSKQHGEAALRTLQVLYNMDIRFWYATQIKGSRSLQKYPQAVENSKRFQFLFRTPEQLVSIFVKRINATKVFGDFPSRLLYYLPKCLAQKLA